MTPPSSINEVRHTTENVLLSPFSIGNVTLRNRIVSTAHSTRYTSGGIPTERYLRYHEEKAKGGVGLVTIGGSAVVSRDSPAAFGNITMYTDEVVPILTEITRSCQKHGAKVFIQLTHLGRRTDDHSADWLPVVSSASLREPAHRSYPKVAEGWDLDRIVDDFVSAAKRARIAGINGIELEHYGHLLDAFASPIHLSHLSAEEQVIAREFPHRVIRAVKQVTGDDMALGVRMSVDELRPDGLVPESALELLREYIDDGIDFVNVVVGTIESANRLSDVIPGAGKAAAPFLDLVGKIKAAIDIPVIHAAKIDEVATAAYAVESGLLDLVGMTRANIADPYLVSKLAQGRIEDIRPCVGARLCLEAGSTGGMTCFNNPATGREHVLSHEIDAPAATSKRVVVVGAGPAGLEAALTAAKRGHSVTVFEAATEAGGQLATLASLPRKREFAGTIEWRIAQARRYGVDLRFGEYAEAAEVLAEEPDAVIVATGGTPRSAAEVGIVGAQHVTDTWDLFERQGRRYGHALLFDDEGRNAALDALEFLAERSDRVTYVTPERTIGVDVGALNYSDYQAVLDRFDIDYRIGRSLTAVEQQADGSFTASLSADSGEVTDRIGCNQLFYSGGIWPNDDLYRELLPHSGNGGRVDYDALIAAQPQPVEHEGMQLFRIGDAVSSRTGHAALLEGHRIALGL